MSASLKLTDQLEGVLKAVVDEYKGASVPLFTATMRWFLWMTQTPRRSHHLDEIRNALTTAIHRIPNARVVTDGAGNLCVFHPGRDSAASAPPVALQAHMDMVCSADNETVFDFAKEAINIRLSDDKKRIHAVGTTLGADNGIGVAAALAAIETNVYGPIYVVITADEETTLGGAEFLEPDVCFSAQGPPSYVINLDSEESAAVCVGCAGGAEFGAILRPDCAAPVEHPVAHELVLVASVTGLPGGHSGCDIHRDRPNAISVLGKALGSLADALAAAHPTVTFHVAGLRAGSAINTIPREAAAVLVLRCADADALAAAQTDAVLWQAPAALLTHDAMIGLKHVDLTSEPRAAPRDLSSVAQSRVLIQAIATGTHGVLGWRADNAEEPDYSVCLSLVTSPVPIDVDGDDLKASWAKYADALSSTVRAVPHARQVVTYGEDLGLTPKEETEYSRLTYLHWFCRFMVADGHGRVRDIVEKFAGGLLEAVAEAVPAIAEDVRSSAAAKAETGALYMTPSFGMSPPWAPVGLGGESKQRSWFLEETVKAVATGHDIAEDTVRVYAVHAALETGYFTGFHTPKAEGVSIGPDITDAHTPREALHLESMPWFTRSLDNLLTKIAENRR